MAFLLFEQIAGPLSSYTPTNFKNHKNIKYGIRANVDFKVTSAGSLAEGKRQGAVFTNVISNIGVPTSILVDAHDNFAGTNAALMDETGHYDRGLVYDSLKMTGHYRLEAAAELSDALSMHACENSAGILYNMLRMWSIAGDDFKEVRFKRSDIAYNDGHVKIDYSSHLGLAAEPAWQLTFDPIVLASGTVSASTFIGNVAVPVLRGLTDKEMALVAAAASAWHSSIPVRAAHSSPALASGVALPVHINTLDSLKDVTRNEVFLLIKKYVNANRLYADFDRAYTMFCEMLFVPAPRSAEAHTWVEPNPVISIPRWNTARGVFSQATQGAAYESMPELKYTFSNWVRTPMRAIMHAMAVTEALYTGFYEIMTAGSGDIFNNLAMLNVAYGDAHTPYRQLIEACSYRFGKGIEMAWHDNFGCAHFTRLLTSEPVPREVIFDWVSKPEPNSYHHVVVKTDTSSYMRLLSPRAEPALYPVLSMGINDDRFFLNKTHYTAMMHVNQNAQTLTTTNPREANKMMAMMRVAGYDITARAASSEKTVRNWAANSNGQVMPLFMPDDGAQDVYIVKVTDIVPRKMSWLAMPSLTGDVEFTCSIKPLSYVVMHNNQYTMDASVGFTYVRSPYGDAKLPNIHTAIAPVRTTPDALPYKYLDFRLAEQRLPTVAATPISALPVSENAHATDTEETLRAEDVIAQRASEQ